MFKNIGPDATREHSMRCMELAVSLWAQLQRDTCNPFAGLRGFAVGAGTLSADSSAGGCPTGEPGERGVPGNSAGSTG